MDTAAVVGILALAIALLALIAVRTRSTPSTPTIEPTTFPLAKQGVTPKLLTKEVPTPAVMIWPSPAPPTTSAGWRRLMVARWGRLWPPYVVIDNEGNRIAEVRRGVVEIGSGDRRAQLRVRRRVGRCRLMTSTGSTLVEALRISGVFRRPRVYELTWGNGRRGELVVERARRSRELKRRGAELRDGSEILDRTYIDYFHRYGGSLGDRPLRGDEQLKPYEHEAWLRGIIDVVHGVPDEVVAMCLLLDLGSWVSYAPHTGRWFEDFGAGG